MRGVGTAKTKKKKKNPNPWFNSIGTKNCGRDGQQTTEIQLRERKEEAQRKRHLWQRGLYQNISMRSPERGGRFTTSPGASRKGVDVP